MTSITSAVRALRASSRQPLLQLVKAGVAAIVSWLVCDALFTEPPIFAAVAALLVDAPSVNQTLTKGLERSVGVIAGVLVALGLGALLGRASWVVLLAILVALVIGWALRLGPGGANQIPISAMLVLSIGAPSPDYAVDRILETIVGAAIGLVVNLVIVPPVLLRPAHLAVQRLARDTAAVLDELAEVLTTPVDDARMDAVLERARALRDARESAAQALVTGRESLMFNPRGGRHRRVIERDAELLERLSALVTRVVGMTRTLRDRYERRLTRDPVIAGIAQELGRAAHDLRLVARDVEGTEPEPVTSEIPALTAPFRVPRPDPEHWILVGSLLEDLRRVREEITGEEES